MSESSLEPLRLMLLQHTAGCSQEHLGGGGHQRTGPGGLGGTSPTRSHTAQSPAGFDIEITGCVKLAHSPVLVPGVCKSSDEDELDEDEGKSTHDAHVMPGWATKEEKQRVQSFLGRLTEGGCKPPASRSLNKDEKDEIYGAIIHSCEAARSDGGCLLPPSGVWGNCPEAGA